MTARLKPNEKVKYWEDKCDILFALIVKIKAGWRCAETGTRNNLQCAHIVSRTYRNTRWDFNNAICLKSGRHVWYTNHPIEWKQYINKLKGEGYYEAMEKKALPLANYSVEELKEKYEQLKAIRDAI